jgi:hypothetical protein
MLKIPYSFTRFGHCMQVGTPTIFLISNFVKLKKRNSFLKKKKKKQREKRAHKLTNGHQLP